MIKTFRGLIADGGQDTIVLHTNDGSTGYRVVKLNIISTTPGVTADEAVVSDNTLVGVGYWSAALYDHTMNIIFDNEIFNQDIYITHLNVSATSNAACNYYIELEQVKLDLSENTVATLKDIRNQA